MGYHICFNALKWKSQCLIWSFPWRIVMSSSGAPDIHHHQFVIFNAMFFKHAKTSHHNENVNVSKRISLWFWFSEAIVWQYIPTKIRLLEYSATTRHIFRDSIPINFWIIIFNVLKTSFISCIVCDFST